MPVNIKSNVTPDTIWTVSCSDFGHPFCPDFCSKAALEVWRDAFKFSLKVYAPLFLVPAIAFQRKPAALLTKTIPSILRSSAFLATLGAGTVPISCALRKIFGRHHIASAVLSGFGAGIISILIEHPSRRPELALYTTNHLIETIFRMLVVRGWIKPIKHGNVLVFMLAMSIISYLYNHKRQYMGNVRGVMKFLLGDKEEHHVSFGEVSTHSLDAPHVPPTISPANSNNNDTTTTNNNNTTTTNTNNTNNNTNNVGGGGEAQQRKQQALTRFQRELFIAFKASVRAFGVGFAVKGALTVLANIRKHFRHPLNLVRLGFLSRDTFKFGLFLTFLVGGWKFTLAILKRVCSSNTSASTALTQQQQPRPWQSLIAGAVAGSSMLVVPNTEIAMYFLSKAGEGLFHTAVGKGWIKPLPYGDAGLFAVCCAALFYCCVYEPFSLRPSYWRFLRDCSGGRFNQFETVARIWCPEYFVKTGFKY